MDGVHIPKVAKWDWMRFVEDFTSLTSCSRWRRITAPNCGIKCGPLDWHVPLRPERISRWWNANQTAGEGKHTHNLWWKIYSLIRVNESLFLMMFHFISFHFISIHFHLPEWDCGRRSWSNPRFLCADSSLWDCSSCTELGDIWKRQRSIDKKRDRKGQ